MQGFNMGRYRPPDSDPRTQSFNSHTGTHPLGKRASKLSTEGTLTVRFELPFNIWCAHCSTHIAQGTRYNAHKKRMGSYLSTPIWAFECKCRNCSGVFVVQTDPQNARYVVTEGATKKEEEWDRDEAEGDNQNTLAGMRVELEGAREKRGLRDAVQGLDSLEKPGGSAPDAFASLEKRTTAGSKEAQRQKRLLELETLANSRSADPYTLNSRLRGTFRTEKKLRQGKERQERRLKLEMGWAEDRKLLLPGEEQDAEEVGREREEWREEKQRRERERVEEAVARGERIREPRTPATASTTSILSSRERSDKSGKARSSLAVDTKKRLRSSPASSSSSSTRLNPTASKLARTLLGRTRRAEDPFGK
ncbi:DUF572-domain-containing protein [Microstroma glucosiphilum]|uniref:DUF572-domain-containing protein n=1 Tax=Pseudomicrostroma glucosiphilum TaxID=1684307 RepID=A0A316UBL3_9BASI|nr:DUF572-domain-containing protein [Pseudomicrostroma glucosiphilum]PWN21841.1 DUF572-domain-containing protein [Pseudomicrostroma glucosiphilum]